MKRADSVRTLERGHSGFVILSQRPPRDYASVSKSAERRARPAGRPRTARGCGTAPRLTQAPDSVRGGARLLAAQRSPPARAARTGRRGGLCSRAGLAGTQAAETSRRVARDEGNGRVSPRVLLSGTATPSAVPARGPTTSPRAAFHVLHEHSNLLIKITELSIEKVSN